MFTCVIEGSFDSGEYVNDYDELLHYECPDNGYVSGVHSIHNNDAEDRIWNFQCCHTPGTQPMILLVMLCFLVLSDICLLFMYLSLCY